MNKQSVVQMIATIKNILSNINIDEEEEVDVEMDQEMEEPDLSQGPEVFLHPNEFC